MKVSCNYCNYSVSMWGGWTGCNKYKKRIFDSITGEQWDYDFCKIKNKNGNCKGWEEENFCLALIRGH